MLQVAAGTARVIPSRRGAESEHHWRRRHVPTDQSWYAHVTACIQHCLRASEIDRANEVDAQHVCAGHTVCGQMKYSVGSLQGGMHLRFVTQVARHEAQRLRADDVRHFRLTYGRERDTAGRGRAHVQQAHFLDVQRSIIQQRSGQTQADKAGPACDGDHFHWESKTGGGERDRKEGRRLHSHPANEGQQ